MAQERRVGQGRVGVALLEAPDVAHDELSGGKEIGGGAGSKQVKLQTGEWRLEKRGECKGGRECS